MDEPKTVVGVIVSELEHHVTAIIIEGDKLRRVQIRRVDLQGSGEDRFTLKEGVRVGQLGAPEKLYGTIEIPRAALS